MTIIGNILRFSSSIILNIHPKAFAIISFDNAKKGGGGIL
jgi:hypothetical protein